MSLPLAAVGAVVAALLEVSVLTDLRIAGVKPDLVFVLAIVSAMVIGVEDGLLWAFLGGLMLDMLLPQRPVGSTILSLLVATGAGIAIAHFLPHAPLVFPSVVVFGLTWVYQLMTGALLSGASGAAAAPNMVPAIVPIAIFNAVLALGAAYVGRRLRFAYAPHDRLEY